MAKESGSTCPAPEVHLLGEVVVAFGTLELSLETSIWQLLRSDDATFILAQAVTANMSFKNKVDSFVSMCREKKIAGAESKLRSLYAKLFKAEEGRNQLLHSAWDYTDIWGGSSFMRMKATAKANDKHGLNRRFYRMPAKDIETTRDNIYAANQLLASFTVEYIQNPEVLASFTVEYIQNPEVKK